MRRLFPYNIIARRAPLIIAATALNAFDDMAKVLKTHMGRNRMIRGEDIAAVFLHFGHHPFDLGGNLFGLIPKHRIDATMEQELIAIAML